MRPWSDHYVGIPFAWNGYDRSGAGCWGLLWLVQREVFGQQLPRHDDWNAHVARGEEAHAGIWRSGIRHEKIEVEDLRSGDVLHLLGAHRGRVSALHVGVAVDPNHVLHTQETTGAIVQRVADIRRRIIQAYRLV